MLENEEQCEEVTEALKMLLKPIILDVLKEIKRLRMKDDTTKPDTYTSISEKFMQGKMSEDEFVEQYNRLIEQDAEKHWEPVEPHEHI